MLRSYLAELFRYAIESLITSGALPAEVREATIEIADPKNPEHGDFACNFAMVAAKKAGKNPRELAEMLSEALAVFQEFESIEVAGPGFINLRVKSSYVASWLPTILTLGPSGISKSTPKGPGKKINVEFVSVNPNGPITIGSGRGAAYGSTLCNVLEAAGNTVHREYYINDGVNSEQMRLFAESVLAITKGKPVPENGYKGDYVHDVAKSLSHIDSDDVDLIRYLSEKEMIQQQRTALSAFGVEYDTWFSEQSLHDKGMVDDEIDLLEQKGIADTAPVRTKLKLAKGNKIEDVFTEIQDTPVDEDGNIITDNSGNSDGHTLWLRSTKLGDDMDRVLLRKDGRLTYIASDVAYHKDKFNRPENADKLITILGPDHHGYIGRLTAVVAAMLLEPFELGEPCHAEIDQKLYRGEGEKAACEAALAEAKNRLEVQIYQLVRFLKDGKPAPMRKRDGNIYALIDLMKEIGLKIKPNGTEEEQLSAGKDVARFFYLMRDHDTTFDFDLDLAEKQSDENPVFYVQYAHARICSILAKADTVLPAESRSKEGSPELFALVSHEKEKAVIKKVLDLSDEVRRASEDYGVHRIATYAVELARTFHAFYDQCKVIQTEDPALSNARLMVCEATKIGLKSALDLLGISAPYRMERADSVPAE